MIVTDSGLKDIGMVDRFRKEVFPHLDPYIFAEVEPNPSCDTVDKAAAIARARNIEVIIGFGGGSAMDAAKGIACLIDTEGSIREFLNAQKVFSSRKCLLIAVPTTSGTGSEVTNVGVFSDPQNHIKKSMVSPFFWNDHAFVDPTLTFTLPRLQTASTGLDALIHALESYWATSSIPLSETIALEAMRLIFENLQIAYEEPANRAARVNMSLASVSAGVAFSQTRTTILHALSYPITNDFHLPHGFACSMLTVPILKANFSTIREKVERLLYYLKINTFDSLIQKIESLMVSLQAPRKLGQIGVQEAHLQGIAEKTLLSPLSRLNPVAFTQSQLVDLLRKEL